MCWLKSNVPARVQNNCCVSGVRGAGVVERRNGAIETSIDRFGGDYKNFDLKARDGDDACKAACTADNKCRAWTYARPGYAGKEAHCFLKKDIKPPRRKAGFTSGVVRYSAGPNFARRYPIYRCSVFSSVQSGDPADQQDTVAQIFHAASIRATQLSAGLSQLVWAGSVPFSAEAFLAALAAGSPFLVVIHASWCPTCKRRADPRQIGGGPEFKI